MTTSPSPAAIHFHSAAAMLVACTSYPEREEVR
jgi:hypothetical protein